MRTHNIPSCYSNSKRSLLCSPDLALSSTLIGSNYPCLELIFMVPKVFERLKFDCIGGDFWYPKTDIKAPDNDETFNWWHFFFYILAFDRIASQWLY